MDLLAPHPLSSLFKYLKHHSADINKTKFQNRLLNLFQHLFGRETLKRIQDGCMGYLLKTTVNADTIIEAIDRVHNGHLYLDKSIQEKYATSIRKNMDQNTSQPKLTNRELEILQGIASELSSQEITDKSYISKGTVDNHCNSLIIKSGAKNTVGLIKFAIDLKLI